MNAMAALMGGMGDTTDEDDDADGRGVVVVVAVVVEGQARLLGAVTEERWSAQM